MRKWQCYWQATTFKEDPLTRNLNTGEDSASIKQIGGYNYLSAYDI